MVDGGLISQKGDSPTKRLCVAIFSQCTHCTQHISHCTLHRAHFTLHTLHTVHYTLLIISHRENAHCNLFTAQHTLNWMFSDTSEVPNEQRKQCACTCAHVTVKRKVSAGGKDAAHSILCAHSPYASGGLAGINFHPQTVT